MAAMDVASMGAQQKVIVYVVVTESRSVLKVTESRAEARMYRDAYHESHHEGKRRAKVKQTFVVI